jgi:hypothetical protein
MTQYNIEELGLVGRVNSVFKNALEFGPSSPKKLVKSHTFYNTFIEQAGGDGISGGGVGLTETEMQIPLCGTMKKPDGFFWKPGAYGGFAAEMKFPISNFQKQEIETLANTTGEVNMYHESGFLYTRITEMFRTLPIVREDKETKYKYIIGFKDVTSYLNKVRERHHEGELVTSNVPIEFFSIYTIDSFNKDDFIGKCLCEYCEWMSKQDKIHPCNDLSQYNRGLLFVNNFDGFESELHRIFNNIDEITRKI